MPPFRFTLLLVVLVLLLAGCEDAIGPAPDDGRVFTLYGQLNARADTQAIIVIPIRDTLGIEPPRPLDARFTSEDLTTGTVQVWRDSLVQRPDGRTRHVFWMPFRAQHEHRYRLRVEDREGRAATAEVPMPPEATYQRLDPVYSFGNRVLLPTEIHNAPVVLDARVRYDLLSSDRELVSYTVPYEATLDGGTWRIEIDLAEDAEAIIEAFGFDMRLRAIELSFFVANRRWEPPLDGFDPTVLIQPGQYSNVSGGFGFVGGGYPLSDRWIPPDSVLARVGLR
jgi:hypothetical protein